MLKIIIVVLTSLILDTDFLFDIWLSTLCSDSLNSASARDQCIKYFNRQCSHITSPVRGEKGGVINDDNECFSFCCGKTNADFLCQMNFCCVDLK